MLNLILKKINRLRISGTLVESSKYLVNRMLSKIDYKQNLTILQLGFGTGVFTKELLNRISEQSVIVVFEVDEYCKKNIMEDFRIQYIWDSAEKITDYFGDKKFDYIVSTLPFGSLPQSVSKNVFREIKYRLKQEGKFLQYQYSLFSRKKITSLYQMRPNIDFEIRNIPPAFIYEIKCSQNNPIGIGSTK